jgi:four helix bundle protein
VLSIRDEPVVCCRRSRAKLRRPEPARNLPHDYDLALGLPRYELYGLGGQSRRSAVSIPSNIAEGSRQRTGRSKACFYTAANASEAELETQLELTRRRKYAAEPDIRKVEELATRVSMMLFRLIDSVDPADEPASHAHEPRTANYVRAFPSSSARADSRSSARPAP